MTGNELTAFIRLFEWADSVAISPEILPRNTQELLSIKKLDLRDLELRNLCDEIGLLSNLEVLDVSYNYLSTLPQSLSKLKNLHTLNASYNQIHTLSQTISNLPHLNNLDISIHSSYTISKPKPVPYKSYNLSSHRYIDNYKIVHSIAVGWEGEVYSAQAPYCGTKRALKILHNDELYIDEMLKIVNRLKTLSVIPHTVRYISCGIDALLESCYIVLEYIEGVTINEWLLHPKKDAERQILCDKLQSLVDTYHTNGLSIGDIHEHNIKLTPQGNLRIIDIDIWQEHDTPKAFAKDKTALQRLLGLIKC